MKKQKRKSIILMTLIILIMQINMMTVVVRAGSNNQVEISIPAWNRSTTYDAYDTLTKAHNNKITIYIKEKDFPVYATIKGSNGGEQAYIFNSYGTKELEVGNAGWGTAMVGLFTFPFGPVFMGDPTAYATIEIKFPKEENILDSAQENTSQSTPENQPVDLYTRLQPLFDKINFQTGKYQYSKEIKDFVSGNWDGSEKSDDDLGVWSSRCVLNRTYYWMGVNEFTGEIYKDIKINLDYLGSLDVVEGKKFTLAVDYSTGVIERWRFLEKEDSWQIVDKGEKINRIVINFSNEEDCLASSIVNTIDEENTEHMYFLKPNGEIQKIN